MNAQNTQQDKPGKITPLTFDIMASASGCWGIGATLEEAKSNCKKAGGRGKMVFAIMPKGSEIDGMCITYPKDAGFVVSPLGRL